MTRAVRPHGLMLLSTDTVLAAMCAVCAPEEWCVVRDDGTWTGPYPDRNSALDAA